MPNKNMDFSGVTLDAHHLAGMIVIAAVLILIAIDRGFAGLRV